MICLKAIPFRSIEWEETFLQESIKATEIKTKIETTNQEIDQMGYALYELTEEDIKIVEGKFREVTQQVTWSHPLSFIK